MISILKGISITNLLIVLVVIVGLVITENPLFVLVMLLMRDTNASMSDLIDLEAIGEEYETDDADGEENRPIGFIWTSADDCAKADPEKYRD